MANQNKIKIRQQSPVVKPITRVVKVRPQERAMQDAPNLCQSCNALPAGSMEIIGILVVLCLSLSAVLFTSLYANKIQTAKAAYWQERV
ncbi:MAG: hypothetical protein AAB833_01555 [Patescibacteria group bacterium]